MHKSVWHSGGLSKVAPPLGGRVKRRLNLVCFFVERERESNVSRKLYSGGTFDDRSLVVQFIINFSREIALLGRNADPPLQTVFGRSNLNRKCHRLDVCKGRSD